MRAWVGAVVVVSGVDSDAAEIDGMNLVQLKYQVGGGGGGGDD